MLLVAFGQVDVYYAILLFVFVYAFSLMFSMWSIFFEEISYHQYNRRGDLLRLILTATIEPILYHPRVVWWAMRGNWDFFVTKKRHGWGDMTRTGFNQPKPPEK